MWRSAIIANMVAVSVAATGACSSTAAPKAARAPVAPVVTVTAAPTSRPAARADGTAPPAINATGTGYAAIARSLLGYRTWLLAHHPDGALASEVLQRGTATYVSSVDELDSLRARHQTRAFATPRTTFAVASVSDALVTLRMHEASTIASPAPSDSVVVITRDANRRWRLADVTRVSGAPRADGGVGTLGGTPPELGVGLLVSVAGRGGSGHQTYGAGDRNAPRPLFERAIPAATGGTAGLSNLCQVPNTPIDPLHPLGNGWVFNIELFDTAEGRDLGTIGAVCVALDPAAPDAPPPPPVIAQPPTIGEVWRAVGLPVPPIGVSPAAHGITGLPTWVWTNGSPAVGVAVGLDGYRVTGSARVVGYGVFAGEGGWARSSVAGGPGEPASEHTYESTGTYRLGVATLWTATAVMTGPGLAAPLTIDLGTALVTNGRDYPVAQIRSHLVG